MVQLLFGTRVFYHDRESRLAVQTCLVAILNRGIDPKLLAWLVKTIRQEAQKSAIAIATSFVLLEWSSLFIQHLAASPLWDQFGNDILLSAADSYERCLQPTSKKSVAQSAKIIARRALRKWFALPEARHKALSDAVKVLTAKSSQPVARNAPLLGVIAGVSSRLSAMKPVIETLKPQFYEFYIREIVGSKTTVADHVAAGLGDFFGEFATLEEVETQIIPPLEKGLLRAPEVILTSVLTPLIASLPVSFDFSTALEEKLLRPLLASVKSSNALVRNGAVTSFRAIVLRCQDVKALESIADEIVTPLKSGKLPSADHRLLHAEMLEGMPLPEASAEKVATSLAAVAGKEGNEAALAAETSALARALTQILSNNAEVPKSVLDVLVKGLAEKKPASRKLWLLRVGSVLKTHASGETTIGMQSFVEAVIPKLVDNLNEVMTNAAAAALNGLIVGAYILTALAPGLHQRFPSSKSLVRVPAAKDALGSGAKESFLLSHRIYSKVSVEEDLHWLSLALSVVSSKLDNKTERVVRLAWSEAIVYLITTSSVSSKVQQETARSLSSLYSQNPGHISELIIDGLWNLMHLGNVKEKELKCGDGHLIQVLRSICPENEVDGESRVEVETLENQACALMVIARPELVPRSSWISLCLRMGVDPGGLARKYQDKLLEEILRRASNDAVSHLHLQTTAQTHSTL